MVKGDQLHQFTDRNANKVSAEVNLQGVITMSKKTVECLAKAFIGESQARNRYAMYAGVASKEGYHQISEIFTITADNEREHAQWLFKMINSLKGGKDIYGEVEVASSAPTACGKTVDNLKAAIAGENWEHITMYPEFADIAESEGHKDIAQRLRSIAKAEVHHEERYTKLLKQLEAGTLFEKDKEVWWFCRKCGYMHKGRAPPEKCPSCDHPPQYFQLMCEEY